MRRRTLITGPAGLAASIMPGPSRGRDAELHGLRIQIDVTAFGALGNGVREADGRVALGTDDTAAVQAAINEAFRSGARSVHFPPGIYCFSRASPSLDPGAGGLDFSGAGSEASVLVWDEGVGFDTGAPDYKALLRHSPVEGEHLGELSFRNLQFRGRLAEVGPVAGGGPAMFLDNYEAITLAGCRFSQIRNMATQCESIRRVEVYGCEFDSVMRDMCRFRSSSSVIISGNHFRHCDDDAVALHQARYVQGHGHIHESIIVSQNEFEDVCGIHILGGRMVSVTGNVMRRCKVHAVAIASEKLEGPNPIFGIEISNNQIYDMLSRPPFANNSQVGIYVAPYSPGSTTDSENEAPAGDVIAPYPLRDHNANNANGVFPNAYAVRITGNIMMRTLPAVHSYTQWGFGPALSDRGWVDPPVPEHSMRPWRALGLPFYGIGLTVRDNHIANAETALGFDGPPALGNRSLNFAIEDNLFYDHSLVCITAKHPVPLRVTGSIGRNIFDGDPYHLAAHRKPDGGWSIGWPTAILFEQFNGAVIEGNIFRNLSRCVWGAELCDLRNNLIEAQPAGLYDALGNLGVGVIPPSGVSWRLRVINANPTSPTFGALLNLCPEQADTCPTLGFFVVGHFVRSTSPKQQFGWVRLTTGDEHVMERDWRAV